jgi:hypothetical protein
MKARRFLVTVGLLELNCGLAMFLFLLVVWLVLMVWIVSPIALLFVSRVAVGAVVMITLGVL